MVKSPVPELMVTPAVSGVYAHTTVPASPEFVSANESVCEPSDTSRTCGVDGVTVLMAGGAGVVTMNVVEPEAPAELVAITFKTVKAKYDVAAIVTRPDDELIDTPAGTAVLSPFVMVQ